MGFHVSKQPHLNWSSLYRSSSLPDILNSPSLKQVVKFKDSTIPDKVKKKYCSNHKELRKVRLFFLFFGQKLFKKTVSLIFISSSPPFWVGGLLWHSFWPCTFTFISSFHFPFLHLHPYIKYLIINMLYYNFGNVIIVLSSQPPFLRSERIQGNSD